MVHSPWCPWCPLGPLTIVHCPLNVRMMQKLFQRILIALLVALAPLHASVEELPDAFSFSDEKTFEEIAPYLLPSDSTLQAPLDAIFSDPSVLDNPHTFKHAGFKILFEQPKSFIIVASHPLLKGYLVKCYLNSEHRRWKREPGWKWLVKRCQGAENVRQLIQRKDLRLFVVPDKWLYPLPNPDDSAEQKMILIVTDMKLVSHSDSEYAWKHKITREHLKELYCILSHGFSSTFLPGNIPYTKKGKFACIDTEVPKRKHNYNAVREFLSKEMRAYWDELVRSGGK